MKLVECWRWRFRDPVSGRVCRTMYAISEEEARKFPQAERVPGTLIMREVDEFHGALNGGRQAALTVARAAPRAAPVALAATATWRHEGPPSRAAGFCEAT